MVTNETRVIQARLRFRKPTGARIEVFCIEPAGPAGHELAFGATGSVLWKCMVGNARKWKEGPVHLEIPGEQGIVKVSAEKEGLQDGDFLIRFHWPDPVLTFGEILEKAGMTPIPPYLDRDPEDGDRERYQTVYNRDPGSVAAPTAGLHFTVPMMKRIAESGIRTSQVTLHVGTGTFVPMKTGDAREHPMHHELAVVELDFLTEWLRRPEKLLAVGTTTTRTLESLFWLGVKLLSGKVRKGETLTLKQWENEALPDAFSLEESIGALVDHATEQGLSRLSFTTGLMIVPGYRFRTISGLITNFHMPGSTLLLLIAAFIGDDWKKVYEYAMENGFRFLSYGDSSLLLPG